MAIEYINVGTIANDGTGDDLREAFVKINNNFEELDLKAAADIPIENVGSLGTAVYAGLVDGVHSFKRLINGQNISISSNETSITIEGTEALEQLIVASENGTISVSNGESITIVGGQGLNTSTNGQTLNIDLASTGIVSSDTAPALSGTLSANNNDIVSANNIIANSFNGELYGNVWGVDIRTLGPFLEGFDFGQAREVYSNALEFILAQIDVEFGFIDPEAGEAVDFGYIS